MRRHLLPQAVELHQDIVLCLGEGGFDSAYASQTPASLSCKNVVQKILTQLAVGDLYVPDHLEMASEIAEQIGDLVLVASCQHGDVVQVSDQLVDPPRHILGALDDVLLPRTAFMLPSPDGIA